MLPTLQLYGSEDHSRIAPKGPCQTPGIEPETKGRYAEGGRKAAKPRQGGHGIVQLQQHADDLRDEGERSAKPANGMSSPRRRCRFPSCFFRLRLLHGHGPLSLEPFRSPGRCVLAVATAAGLLICSSPAEISRAINQSTVYPFALNRSVMDESCINQNRRSSRSPVLLSAKIEIFGAEVSVILRNFPAKER